MIEILSETTKEPLQLIGKIAAVCYNSDTSDILKNKKRAWECINSGHGRVMEWPEVFLNISGYSAKTIRELARHTVGISFLQASTRYLNYDKKGISCITPKSISKNEQAKLVWNKEIENIKSSIKELMELGIPKEDANNLLPLAYETFVTYKINLRALEHLMNTRLCTRAYWEINNLMKEIKQALSEYSEEWKEIADKILIIKCEKSGYCTETKSCNHRPKKEEN